MLHAAELLKHRFDNLLDLRRCQILFCRVSRAVHWRHPVPLRMAAIHEVLQLTPIENLHVVPRLIVRWRHTSVLELTCLPHAAVVVGLLHLARVDDFSCERTEASASRDRLNRTKHAQRSRTFQSSPSNCQTYNPPFCQRSLMYS